MTGKEALLKVLDIFKNMTPEEYEELYKSLKQECEHEFCPYSVDRYCSQDGVVHRESELGYACKKCGKTFRSQT